MSTANYDQVLAATRATLERIAADFAPAIFASSLAAEDMVLTDLILKAKLPIKIFTLETGRLHAETLGVLDAVRSTYGVNLTLYKPEPAALETYVRENGLNAFYDSVEMRKECCRIRKVEPLNRALAGNKAWITGQRRAQSTTRSELAVQEDDAAHAMQKFNPLTDWTEDHVWHYIRSNEAPYTTKAIPLSVANPARAPYKPAKIYVLVAGGGNPLTPKNVGCTSLTANSSESNPLRTRHQHHEYPR